MDFNNVNDEVDDEGGGKGELFFIEDLSSSEGELEIRHQTSRITYKRASRRSREGSPPLLLAFSTTPGPAPQSSSLSPTSSLTSEEEEDSDQHIEEWMILGREELLGDSNIQLNLSYWGDEDDSGEEDHNVKSAEDAWAVSEKDKYGTDPCLPTRYFVPGGSLICDICKRTGHLSKSCYYNKKVPSCILCGIQGHIRRDCPGRHCPSCGMPSHGFRPCQRPPLWNQHCQRCGVAGHLSDACPDTWRQYHLTVRLEAPLRPHATHALKYSKSPPHCYNCSERGHYGYECTKRRMISGTSPSPPFVCHYDTMEDILQCRTRLQRRTKEVLSVGSLPDTQNSEPAGDSSEENQTVQGRSRTKQDTCGRVGRRKTWPERRRERREVKRLRREAQARREGGLLGRSRGSFDDEVGTGDPLRSPLYSHCQSPPHSHKKRRDEESANKSRKNREAERWKKRGGIKRGDLYPYGDMDINSENLLSPKQRVRHRRR